MRVVAGLCLLGWLAIVPVGALGNDCDQEKGNTARVECHAERAVQAGERAPCNGAADVRVRDQCYGVYAVRVGDAASCRAIPGEGQRPTRLRQICLSDVAIVSADGSLCGEIADPGLRDTCHLKVARDTENADLCERIEQDGLRALCER